MKKILVALLLTALTVCLSACGATSSEPADADTEAISTDETEVQETPVAEDTYQNVNFGDTISLDFAEITIEGLDYGLGIHEEEGNSSFSFNGDAPMCWLKGTIKNLYTDYIDPRASNSYVKMIFDGKYNYTGSIYARSSSFDGLAALETNSVYIYTDVSEEILNTFTTVKVIFGFTENFNSPEIYNLEGFDECDYIYQLEASK